MWKYIKTVNRGDGGERMSKKGLDRTKGNDIVFTLNLNRTGFPSGSQGNS